MPLTRTTLPTGRRSTRGRGPTAPRSCSATSSGSSSTSSKPPTTESASIWSRATRISFTGSFLQTEIRRTDVALRVDSADTRWGAGFANGVLEGSSHAILNRSGAYVKATDTRLEGPTEGIVHLMDGSVPNYPERAVPNVTRARLYDVSQARYRAPRTIGRLPTQDATPAIRKALDRAGKAGGGVVYLPAGWYRVETHLTVPANVELRGASSVANRDQSGASRGTVLMAYEGRATAEAESSTAFITLNGERAGVRGLRVFHPENNPAGPDGLVPYPYTVRGNGEQTYVVNVGLTNSWNALDFRTHRTDGFFVRKVAGVLLNRGVTVGAAADGRVEGVLSNGNAAVRTGFGIPGWGVEANVFSQVINPYTRRQLPLLLVDGAERLNVLNAFAYGSNKGLDVRSGQVGAFNLGTDNLGSGGYSVDVDRGDVSAVNVMRYNGTTLRGTAELRNIMAIGMVQHAVTASASPEHGGSVSISGNATEPGSYERGSSVVITGTPAPGYRFVQWTEDGEPVSDDPSYGFEVTGSRHLVAVFEQ